MCRGKSEKVDKEEHPANGSHRSEKVGRSCYSNEIDTIQIIASIPVSLVKYDGSE